jgi:hypothetical protein
MIRPAAIFAGSLAIFAMSAAFAQTSPGEVAKSMVGSWELSNADHDKTCNVAFKLDPVGSGYLLSFANDCAGLFPIVRDIASWSLGKRDTLLLNGAKGQPLLEMLEVEVGTYEGLRPNEGRYVLQNAAIAAATRNRTADQLFGEWAFVRGSGNPICLVTFANVAADADSFSMTVKPGCDPVVSRFGPVSWQLDRGQLLLRSAKGEAWRFEESEAAGWRRIPESRPPLLLVRQ